LSWSRRFEDPVRLSDGRELLTLRNAADHIQKLPAVEARREQWQTAIGILIAAAEQRDFLMHARIAMLRAINFRRPRPAPAPRRRKAAKVYRVIR